MSARKAPVDLDRHGDQDIQPDQDSRTSCATLQEAEQVAHICAAYQQPCELLVCEAYNRALHCNR